MVGKHTPGPFTITRPGSFVFGARITGSDGHDVAALVVNGKNHERGAANLSVLAAAPDMLAALKAAETALQVAFDAEGDTFGRHHNDAADALSSCRRAIARAEGRLKP